MQNKPVLCFPIPLLHANTGKYNYFERLKEKERYKLGPFYCAKSRGTHKQMPDGNDPTHAIDFLVENGTPVRAVLDGTIVAITDSNTEYGQTSKFADKLNEFVIRHCTEKGEQFFTQYAHIQANSVTGKGFRVGQTVSKGEVVGNVGANGQMIFDSDKLPLYHLHFMLFKVVNSKTVSLHPVFESECYFKIEKVLNCVLNFFSFFFKKPTRA